jgi:hypothetical protein
VRMVAFDMQLGGLMQLQSLSCECGSVRITAHPSLQTIAIRMAVHQCIKHRLFLATAPWLVPGLPGWRSRCGHGWAVDPRSSVHRVPRSQNGSEYHAAGGDYH